MKESSWSVCGFWLAMGLAGGLLISNLTTTQTVSASGSSSFNEEYRIVTGKSYDGEIDVVWLLDYRGASLQCLTIDRVGKFQVLGKLDLIEQFELGEDGRSKPKFMLVTGRHSTKSVDVAYIGETTTGQLLCVMPPFVNGRAPGQKFLMQIIDRFKFRPTDEKIRRQ